jgi:UDP-arabinose 4-epimerase
MKLEQTKILVTGGAGYIGSHACKALKQAGFEPVVFDHLGRGHESSVKWGPLIRGDLRDRATLERCLNEHRIRAVMHFAAYAYVGESTENPGLYFENNVGGTLNLLEAMKATGVDTLVFSSTCATYGNPTTIPMTEEHPQAPINPYGASKWMSERMILDFQRAHGLKSALLRYFNAAGADPAGEIGENHEPETHLIPLAVRGALRGEALRIFGTDYPTPDGSCIRDYIHVSDLADAHVLALQGMMEGGGSGIYNLGNGSGYSVLEVVHMVEQVTGRSIRKEVWPRRAGDPPVLIANAHRARQTLGWAPRYPDLETIVRHAVEWEQKKS